MLCHFQLMVRPQLVAADQHLVFFLHHHLFDRRRLWTASMHQHRLCANQGHVHLRHLWRLLSHQNSLTSKILHPEEEAVVEEGSCHQ